MPGETGYHGTEQHTDRWCWCIEVARTDNRGTMGSNMRGTRWLQVHNTNGMGEDRQRGGRVKCSQDARLRHGVRCVWNAAECMGKDQGGYVGACVVCDLRGRETRVTRT